MRKEKEMKTVMAVLVMFFLVFLCFFDQATAVEDSCIACHSKVSPGQVADWRSSIHSEEGITCSECHGMKHTTAEDAKQSEFPDESQCGECHEHQLNQFVKGKHNLGWTSMLALPVTHVEPDELMEGGRGCGGCHNMGVKSEAQKQDQLKLGYRYQNN
ncbi:MAG: cytochrome C, partial [Nitrospira bacterium SG8_3]